MMKLKANTSRKRGRVILTISSASVIGVTDQFKMLIELGYLKECGYYTVGKTHSLKIVSVNPDYVYEFHDRLTAIQNNTLSASVPRLVKLTNTKYWTSEKSKSSKVHSSGSSLSMVIATGNY